MTINPTILQPWVWKLPTEDRQLLAKSLSFSSSPGDFLAAMKELRKKHPDLVPDRYEATPLLWRDDS